MHQKKYLLVFNVMDTVHQNPWKTIKSELQYDNSWIKVTEHSVIDASGNNGIYGTVHFKNLALGIIPLDEDYNTWLVGQYRYPLNQYSWEICEGGGQIGIDPIKSAQRELLEEVGLKADKWTPIMEMHLSNSVSDELSIIYIAKGLTYHDPEPDDDEVLELKKLPFNAVFEMVMNGEITDSLSVAGILKTKLLIDQGKV